MHFPLLTHGQRKCSSWLREPKVRKMSLLCESFSVVLLSSILLCVEDIWVNYLKIMLLFLELIKTVHSKEIDFFSCLYTKVWILESSFDFKTSDLEIHL